jgi:CBS domain-containing protein
MEQQPRDESRAATVREGGPESWTEAGEMIDTPSNMPTAAGSRTTSGSVPPAGGEATAGMSSQAAADAQKRRAGTSASKVEPIRPGGADFSSSAAPAGQGSNTPIGAEPDNFRHWDAQQEEPGTFGHGERTFMMPSLSSLGGVAATAAVGGLSYMWWQRRQKRQTRSERLKAALLAAGASLGATAGGELPRLIGQAAAQSKSAWLPLALLPLGLYLREKGKAGERASDALLQPLDLEKRSRDLTRQGSHMLDDYRKRLVREVDPAYNKGWGWTPWLFGSALAGGAYLAYRQGWLGAAMPSNGMMSSHSGTAVREVMTRGVETVAPDATIAEVARRMRDLDVGSLPVCDGSRLVGIVTDRDLSVRATAAEKDPNSTRVRDVMSPQLTWVFEDEPADAAARVMRERQIRRLPVLDRSDRLVGVVALADLATDLGDDKLKGATLEEISQPSGIGR